MAAAPYQDEDGDKVILSDGKLSLVRDMHRPRRYKGKTVYDMAYWAIATSEEGEA